MNKESVKLRRRELSSGNTSLYLDIYRRGVRRTEYLKLYLIPERSRADRQRNQRTLQLAEAIRSKRHVEMVNGEFGFQITTSDDQLFFPYASKVAQGKRASSTKVTLLHIRRYDDRPDLTFNDITQKWVEGFIAYLDQAPSHLSPSHKLQPNSKRLYLTCLKIIIHHAQRKGIMHHDPFKGVEIWKAKEPTREHLTIDEVRRLVEVRCDNDRLKRAFLFSCLTGLRRSDITRLRWGNVQQQGAFIRIVFRQQKTGGLEYLDITPQARVLMGERKSDKSLVFGELPSIITTNKMLRRWMERADIHKKITYHCARHTFAIMMLDIGTDLYVVSKLLGHRKLATTQIYARILDKNKQQAVAKIPNIFGII